MGDAALLQCVSRSLTPSTLEDLRHLTRRHKAHDAISLRMVEYLCNNFSKDIPVVTATNQDLHSQYLAAQEQFKRQKFGAFRRQAERWIPVSVTWEDKQLDSSMAQLNFMLFVQRHGLMKFIASNIDHIRRHRRERSSVKPKRGGKRRVLNPCRATPRGRLAVMEIRS